MGKYKNARGQNGVVMGQFRGRLIAALGLVVLLDLFCSSLLQLVHNTPHHQGAGSIGHIRQVCPRVRVGAPWQRRHQLWAGVPWHRQVRGRAPWRRQGCS